jgi:hypothetical protein
MLQQAALARPRAKHIRIEQVLNTLAESFMLSRQSFELSARDAEFFSGKGDLL